MIVFNRYSYQFDIYLGFHVIPVVANKNTYGYILRNTNNHQLMDFDCLLRTVKLVKGHSRKLKNEMESETQLELVLFTSTALLMNQ